MKLLSALIDTSYTHIAVDAENAYLYYYNLLPVISPYIQILLYCNECKGSDSVWSFVLLVEY